MDEPRCLRSVSSSRYKAPAVLFIVKCDQMLSVIEERKHLHKKEKIHRYVRNGEPVHRLHNGEPVHKDDCIIDIS